MRMKHGPVNATAVLPPALVTALQRFAAGRRVYIPAIELPAARRWRDARRWRLEGHRLTSIAELLSVQPRTAARLLATPRPRARATAAVFDTPAKRAVLRRVQQHVEACILYVPALTSKPQRRRQRIHQLFVRGWTAARVATHLGMNARYMGRLYAAWRAAREAEGRTVTPGRPLISPEERAREHQAAERRKNARAEAKRRREEQARLLRVFGDDSVQLPSVRPGIVEWPT